MTTAKEAVRRVVSSEWNYRRSEANEWRSHDMSRQLSPLTKRDVVESLIDLLKTHPMPEMKKTRFKEETSHRPRDSCNLSNQN
jgi:hypothetical protein